MRFMYPAVALFALGAIFGTPAFADTVDLDCTTPASPTSFHVFIDIAAATVTMGVATVSAEVSDAQVSWEIATDSPDPNIGHVVQDYTLDRDTGTLAIRSTMTREVGWQNSTATCRKAQKVL